jgi:RND family efflux transporter MFP subunit
MKSSKSRLLAIPIIVLVIAGIGYAVYSGKAPEQGGKRAAPASKPALTITTVRPRQTSLPIRLTANGDIAAWQEASIGSELNGLRLTEVRVNVGDTVRAGQVLAVFAPETVRAEVMAARAAVMEAEATAAEAANNAARARTLQKTGALSEVQINQYVTAEQTAKARVEAARAQLAAQQLRNQYLQVVAPDSGVISARSATVGAIANAGTELFRMIRKGRLEWRARVISADLGRLSEGMPATITAVNGAQIQGKVRMIAPTVDLQNREGLVYVDLQSSQDKPAQVRAGMFAKGEFNLGESSALTVPQQSVVLREGFNYVYVLTPERRVQQVKVQTGRRIGDQVEIRDGLRPDAQIVASGAGFLNDGDLVRVEDAPVSQPAAASQQPAVPSQPTAAR